jgi:hypothetical protein
MADINPTYIQATNNGTQDLFTITESIATTEENRGVPLIYGNGNSAVVVFTNLDSDIDSDASIDPATGQIGLDNAGQTYLITAQLNFTGTTPVSIKFVETETGTQHGVTAPAGQTLQVSITPGDSLYYQIVAFTNDGRDFVYPNQLKNASVSVQAVAGYPAP